MAGDAAADGAVQVAAGCLDTENAAADAEGVARTQDSRADDTLPVDVDAVGRAEVGDGEATRTGVEAGVAAGELSVGQRDRVASLATDGGGAVDREGLASVRTGLDAKGEGHGHRR